MAVYFDASVLRQLPRDLSSPDLTRLQEVAAKVGIGLFIPEVAAKEWIFHHRGIVKGKYGVIRSAAHAIGQYLNRAPLSHEVLSVEKLMAQVGQLQESYLEAAGLAVVATPEVPLKTLIEMSIPWRAANREAPCQIESRPAQLPSRSDRS